MTNLKDENRLEEVVDRNLEQNYNMEEVGMMIKIALLCTQSQPEERPAMSDIVRMLEGEGQNQRWEDWQNLERNHEIGRKMRWEDDSTCHQDPMELSGGR